MLKTKLYQFIPICITLAVIMLTTPARAYDINAMDQALNEAAKQTDVALFECQHDYLSELARAMDDLEDKKHIDK